MDDKLRTKNIDDEITRIINAYNRVREYEKIKEHKDRGRKYIVQKLMDAGVIKAKNLLVGYQILHRWTNKYRVLKFRQKPPGMYIVADDAEIYQIIREFSPGGEYWWEPGKERFQPEEIVLNIPEQPNDKVYEVPINTPTEILYPETTTVIPEV